MNVHPHLLLRKALATSALFVILVFSSTMSIASCSSANVAAINSNGRSIGAGMMISKFSVLANGGARTRRGVAASPFAAGTMASPSSLRALKSYRSKHNTMKQKSRFDALFVSDGYFTSASRERALQSTSHYQSIQPRAAYSITGDGSKLKMKLQLPLPTSFVSRHKFKRQFSITAQNMSTATSQTDTSISNSLELQLSDEEQTIYQELSSLSAKIRRLDEIYYGGISDASDSFAITKDDSEKKSDASTTAIYGDVSDDEYDALARREAELCTMFPRLLTLLENESGLGKQATRFGGRVGQLYEEIDTAAEEIDASSKKAKTKVKPKAKAVSSTKKRIKRQHLSNAPMQSLDNAMNDLEAVAWLNRVRKLLLSAAMKDVSTSENNIGHSIDEDENATTNNATAITIPLQILAEPKIDGLSLSLRYQLRDTATPNNDGTEHEYVYDFVWGATRGDGTQGEDVSEAVQSAWMKSNTILEDEHSSIPRSFSIASDKSNPNIDPPATLEIRGEVVLPLKSFEEFTRNLTTDLIESSNTTDDNSTTTTKSIPTYTNARNAASGILLRSKEPTSQEDIERTRWLQSRLKFYAYDIVSSSSSLISKDENIELPGSWLYEMVGKSGKDMMNILNKLGFSIPNPVVVESVNISSERELEDTDVPTLLEYHRNLMTARDASIAINDNKKNKKKQFNFPYQIDGVVYKVSAMENRQTCGSSSRTPRWAIAHKFPPECAITQLINIEVQVGRTGALTPVAILKPVDLGGVMVSRASLHNFHFAKKILLAGDHSSDSMTSKEETMEVKRGVSVLVSRAGDVIPQVMKRIFDDEVENEISSAEHEWLSLAPPVNCPACGSPTSFDFVTSPARKKGGKKASKLLSENNGDDNVSVVDLMEGVDMNMDSDDQSSVLVETSDDPENGQVLRCSGPQLLCQPRSVGAIVHAYSRTGLDVKGISESRLRQLIEENIIRFPADLFQVFGNKHGDSQSKEEEMLEKIADLPGWGPLSSQNLAESVQTVASGSVPLSRFIYSLGIRFIGTQGSQLIASSYKNIDAFLGALDKASSYNEENDEDDNVPFTLLVGDNESEKVKGIGPTALSALLAFSKEEVLMKAARDLANALTILDDESGNTSLTNTPTGGDDTNANPSPFDGMTIVFTGTLPSMSRTAAQTTVKERGAKATPNTVSKSTSLVVEGEKGGKKARQAREMGIRVIDADEFMQLLETY